MWECDFVAVFLAGKNWTCVRVTQPPFPPFFFSFKKFCCFLEETTFTLAYTSTPKIVLKHSFTPDTGTCEMPRFQADQGKDQVGFPRNNAAFCAQCERAFAAAWGFFFGGVGGVPRTNLKIDLDAIVNTQTRGIFHQRIPFKSTHRKSGHEMLKFPVFLCFISFPQHNEKALWNHHVYDVLYCTTKATYVLLLGPSIHDTGSPIAMVIEVNIHKQLSWPVPKVTEYRLPSMQLLRTKLSLISLCFGVQKPNSTLTVL